MKITKVETLHCYAGWRPWSFIKITTDEGIVGYSECTDSHGSPRGITGCVKDLEPLLLEQDPGAVEKLYWDMYRATRQSPGSIIQKAIGGIENALLDIKAKALGIPVY
ncbi:MAG TPA: mandelate racemase/muconate lactonizing enzyme family protein, partial [Hadesarchaea archaeon]|nr:mandelate racemase/muconate lactonizing enzyme family protein [Hadesarchaea archaeon]